jgi:hypothetical protein
MELSVGEVADFIHHPGADIYNEYFNIEKRPVTTAGGERRRSDRTCMVWCVSVIMGEIKGLWLST